jgi:hypothetical protein
VQPDGALRRFRCQFDNHSRFPDVCAKSENGFVAGENCFVATSGRNIHPEKFNDFSQIETTARQRWKNRLGLAPIIIVSGNWNGDLRFGVRSNFLTFLWWRSLDTALQWRANAAAAYSI